MKRRADYAAALLALCLTAVLTAFPARAAGTGDTIEVGTKDDLWQVIAGVKDGDTIVLAEGATATDPSSKDAPLVIGKAVTIQGGSLEVRAGGIILEADVTFRDTVLAFSGNVRNAIMANGHTLTLENVGCSQNTAQPFNLFCGGLYDPDGYGSTPGQAGKIVIKGKTSQVCRGVSGELFAGNLCMGGMNAADSAMNGPANAFAGDAEISIETDDAELGAIYAGGAQQRIPLGSESGKVTLADPEEYTVTGSVRVRLRNGSVPQVDGRGAGAVHVTYTGNDYLQDRLVLKEVSSLTVESGSVAPAAGSSFREGAAVAVQAGAMLDLKSFGDLTAGSFAGGGSLILGREQTLRVTGAVTGATTVGIESIGPGGFSPYPPVEEHVYIRAPRSGSGSFRLARTDEKPNMAFVWDEASGTWASPKSGTVLVGSVRFQDERTVQASGEYEISLPLEVEYAENDAYSDLLDFIPLTIAVNGTRTDRSMDDVYGEYYIYTAEQEGLVLEVSDDELTVTAVDEETVPEGTYAIEIEVPETNTGTGAALRASAVLIVGEEPPAPGPEPGPAYQIESVSVGSGSVVCTIGAAEGPASLMAAAYTAEGRLLDAASAPVEGPGVVRAALDTSGAGYVKAFLLDSANAPLCEHVRSEIGTA